MRFTRSGFRQSFGGAASVCALPEDGAVALTIGLTGDPFAGSPHGKTVVSLEGKMPHSGPAREIVNVDGGPAALQALHCDLGTVRRYARCFINMRWKPERLDLSFPVCNGKIPARRHRPGKVDKGAVFRKAVVGSPCRVRVRARDPFDKWNGAPCYRELFGIEGHREQIAAYGIDKVARRNIAGVAAPFANRGPFSGYQILGDNASLVPEVGSRNISKCVQEMAPAGQKLWPVDELALLHSD